MEKSELRNICQTYITKGATAVPEHVSKQIIREYGVAVPKGAVVQSVADGIQFAGEVGYPVVLKAVSAEILHKTELKGVALNLQSSDDLKRAHHEMQSAFSDRKERLEEFLIEKMIPSGAELIVAPVVSLFIYWMM
jgi:acetyltransferase